MSRLSTPTKRRWSWLSHDQRLPDRQRLGQESERFAARFLVSQGYAILETNVRARLGEIDLVAREGQMLCFIEVRSASSLQWGGPLASITDRKRRRLIRAAQWFVSQRKPSVPELRFDVVGVTWNASGEPSCELIRGAFDAG